MSFLRASVVFILLTLPPCAMAEEWRTYTLSNEVTLRMRSDAPSRSTPYAYVDQGLDTITTQGKQQVLMSRRYGTLGNGERRIAYSLIAMRDKTGALEVEISGQVTAGGKAWTYQTHVKTDSWQDSVLVVIEALSKLPDESAMGKSATMPGALFERAALGIASRTSIPVYVPVSIQSLDRDAIDGCTSVHYGPNEFSIELYGRVTEYGQTTPLPCEPSGAALVAEIHGDAKPMPSLSGRGQPVTLQNGDKGWFLPASCGASCAPATLYWQTPRGSYWIQLGFGSTVPAATQLKEMLAMVNSARIIK